MRFKVIIEEYDSLETLEVKRSIGSGGTIWEAINDAGCTHTTGDIEFED